MHITNFASGMFAKSGETMSDDGFSKTWTRSTVTGTIRFESVHEYSRDVITEVTQCSKITGWIPTVNGATDGKDLLKTTVEHGVTGVIHEMKSLESTVKVRHSNVGGTTDGRVNEVWHKFDVEERNGGGGRDYSEGKLMDMKTGGARVKLRLFDLSRSIGVFAAARRLRRGSVQSGEQGVREEKSGWKPRAQVIDDKRHQMSAITCLSKRTTPGGDLRDHE